MIFAITTLLVAILMEIIEIYTSKKELIEKAIWIMGLLFFAPIVCVVYYFFGRSELTR